MLQLRVYGEAHAMAAVAESLDGRSGVRHVTMSGTGSASGALVVADVRADAADAVLDIVDHAGVPAADVLLVPSTRSASRPILPPSSGRTCSARPGYRRARPADISR